MNLELLINIPRIENHPQIVTQVLVIEMPANCFLVFGFSDGTVLVSEIKSDNDQLLWTPIKKITMLLEGVCGVEYLSYNEKIDTLIVGNTFSSVFFISNLFSDGLGIKLSTSLEVSIDQEI